ncbi:ferrochelatase [Marinobacterium sediminicola]|uniref:Ferrochelatase n=1 Tax=Marinobacterium sediminicola TaxID=518898 RepID=A0ABY1RW12_9GAMM|nr:ferrochelatase [Marinobacterium sediminicola]ULG70805.1 ferrochelatase [Marinobacterium sediminicola]SMR69195.1 ferrochelatase [Marinobacterium sediminicola]
MAYRGVDDFKHSQQDLTGVLITNLGTPDEPTPSALRRYLKEFLWDPRVVEVPRPVWWCILNGIILNVRPRRSAAAYREVWTEAGSPLMLHTEEQTRQLRQRLQSHFGQNVMVEFAMRYGNPSISSVIERMQKAGVRRLLVLPLYPQYSGATSASTFDAVAEDFRQRRWLPELRMINHYHDFPDYIEALAASVERHWQQHGRADKMIMSYHGVPKRYLMQGDPYFCECHKTSRLLAERLQLEPGQWMTTFQSRFGREEWLKPYTDETLKGLPAEGVKSVQVICPGFSADCLETIEEIGQENRDYFLEAGGERYEYIPALNADVQHIDALEKLVLNHLQGWEINTEIDFAQRQKIAQAQGAER